ncbi:MAG: glycine betaine/L-proline ABC transporter ATP-binding protein [Alicyclobacillaceae bacterium]|nr:glycine betaine/L-proline ABC transporter ATP-binding protein [Alicyclobacillaceae bacterium]
MHLQSKKRGDPIIRLSDVTKIFGSHPHRAMEWVLQGYSREEIKKKTGQNVAVHRVSFEVYPGEIFVVMGLSGSGKSTLLRCINRLIRPTAGKIWVDNVEVTALEDKALRLFRQRRIGMVFQQFALFPHRNVLENVAFGLEVQGVPKRERNKRAQACLELVGLNGWENHDPDELSGGMQQRVGLARALCNDPDILLMDEAFSALDPLIREEMQDELIRLQQSMKKTILFITHDLNEALKLGDRIALMRDGEVVQIGTPEEIVSRPRDEYVARFVRGANMTKILTAADVMKHPEPVATLRDGPRVALHRMRQAGISSLFVVDRDYRLAGLVHADDAFAASERGESRLEAILTQDFSRVLPETPIEDLLPILAEGKSPLAVADAEDRLLGVIVRGAVLEALASKGGGRPVQDSPSSVG